jgi:hypothetical protein
MDKILRSQQLLDGVSSQVGMMMRSQSQADAIKVALLLCPVCGIFQEVPPEPQDVVAERSRVLDAIASRTTLLFHV